jgi:hypothetical protein
MFADPAATAAVVGVDHNISCSAIVGFDIKNQKNFHFPIHKPVQVAIQ